MMLKRNVFLFCVLSGLLLTACGQAAVSDVPNEPKTVVESAPTEAAVVEPTAAATAEPVEEAAAEDVEVDEPDVPTAVPTEVAVETAVPEMVIQPIEVTYFTPSQGEGPFYTVNKPEDRDNDLVVLEGATAVPDGEILELNGKVYDASGMPLSGIVIEIWQTDNNGVYLHPNDPTTEQRDRNFQFYGEAVTAADGSYFFRTIIPGRYEPRPVHIHVKIKAGGQEILTTQFYFEGDPALEADGLFRGAAEGQHMIVALSEGADAAGNPIFIGQRDVVLRVELPAFYAQ